MSRGPSGRLVVELDTELKQQLYSALALHGLTFKEWVATQAREYILKSKSSFLMVAEPPATLYQARRQKNKQQ